MVELSCLYIIYGSHGNIFFQHRDVFDTSLTYRINIQGEWCWDLLLLYRYKRIRKGVSGAWLKLTKGFANVYAYIGGTYFEIHESMCPILCLIMYIPIKIYLDVYICVFCLIVNY